MLSWKHFQIRAKARIADAEARRARLTLLRLTFLNMHEVEEYAGIEVAAGALGKIHRLGGTDCPPARDKLHGLRFRAAHPLRKSGSRQDSAGSAQTD